MSFIFMLNRFYVTEAPIKVMKLTPPTDETVEWLSSKFLETLIAPVTPRLF